MYPQITYWLSLESGHGLRPIRDGLKADTAQTAQPGGEGALCQATDNTSRVRRQVWKQLRIQEIKTLVRIDLHRLRYHLSRAWCPSESHNACTEAKSRSDKFARRFNRTGDPAQGGPEAASAVPAAGRAQPGRPTSVRGRDPPAPAPQRTGTPKRPPPPPGARRGTGPPAAPGGGWGRRSRPLPPRAAPPLTSEAPLVPFQGLLQGGLPAGRPHEERSGRHRHPLCLPALRNRRRLPKNHNSHNACGYLPFLPRLLSANRCHLRPAPAERGGDAGGGNAPRKLQVPACRAARLGPWSPRGPPQPLLSPRFGPRPRLRTSAALPPTSPGPQRRGTAQVRSWPRRAGGGSGVYLPPTACPGACAVPARRGDSYCLEAAQAQLGPAAARPLAPAPCLPPPPPALCALGRRLRSAAPRCAR